MSTAFITGSATGIGKAIVERLARSDWQVFAGHLENEELEPRWLKNPNITPVVCDVTNVEQIQKAADLVSDATGGKLDFLLNNAGYAGNCGVVEAADMKEYHRHFDINFWGAMNMVQGFSPLIRAAKGRIVNTASASVYMTIPMGSAYPVSKTALKALTNSLRIEMAPFGVEVTSLEPGGVDTGMTAPTEERKQAQWDSVAEDIRDQYRQHFVDGYTAIGSNFKFLLPNEFANEIYNQIICAKTLKPYYLIGPGVRPLPWLHRLLPVQKVLDIWVKLFSKK